MQGRCGSWRRAAATWALLGHTRLNTSAAAAAAIAGKLLRLSPSQKKRRMRDFTARPHTAPPMSWLARTSATAPAACAAHAGTPNTGAPHRQAPSAWSRVSAGSAPHGRIAWARGVRRRAARRARVEPRAALASLGADHEPDLAAARGVHAMSVTWGLACAQCMPEMTVLHEVGACGVRRRLACMKLAPVFQTGGHRPDTTPPRAGRPQPGPPARHTCSQCATAAGNHARTRGFAIVRSCTARPSGLGRQASQAR
jgi:hypothetical protein